MSRFEGIALFERRSVNGDKKRKEWKEWKERKSEGMEKTRDCQCEASRRMAERMEMSIFIGRVCKRQPIPIQNALKMEMGKRPGEKEER